METLEELKAIIAGKPEGATHINTILPKELDIINYVNTNNFTWWHEGVSEWKSFGGMIDITFRSLSDIERIIELMECLKSIEQTVEGGDVLGCWDMMKIKDCLK